MIDSNFFGSFAISDACSCMWEVCSIWDQGKHGSGTAVSGSVWGVCFGRSGPMFVEPCHEPQWTERLDQSKAPVRSHQTQADRITQVRLDDGDPPLHSFLLPVLLHVSDLNFYFWSEINFVFVASQNYIPACCWFSECKSYSNPSIKSIGEIVGSPVVSSVAELKDFLFQVKFLYLYLPLVCTSHSECVTVEGPKPDGVPDRECHGPMKLLQFHENYRPAYWGTWSKKSSHISPRCPLRQDKVKLFSSQYG